MSLGKKWPQGVPFMAKLKPKPNSSVEYGYFSLADYTLALKVGLVRFSYINLGTGTGSTHLLNL